MCIRDRWIVDVLQPRVNNDTQDEALTARHRRGAALRCRRSNWSPPRDQDQAVVRMNPVGYLSSRSGFATLERLISDPLNWTPANFWLRRRSVPASVSERHPSP